jgi:hypothetical protein
MKMAADVTWIEPMTTDLRARPAAAWTTGEFYRQCRIWHGYLSALTFVALLFFSATGVLMNHPGWLRSSPASAEKSFTLNDAQRAGLKGAAAPGQQLVKLVGAQMALRGGFAPGESPGEVDGDQLRVKLISARGWSDIHANLRTGEVKVEVSRNSLVTVLNGLHKAQASAPWRLLIDIAAGAMIAVSLIGFVLFLSLRLRLRTSLALVGLGLSVMVALFFATVR